MRRKRHTTAASPGFSIIELLIAVIIIGILAAIAIPIISERASQARISAALSDLEHIKDAEQRIGTDIGYFVRLEVLDDLAGAQGSLPGGDLFKDEPVPNLFFIDARSGATLQSPPWADGSHSDIMDGIDAVEPTMSTTAWKGPYVSWRKWRPASGNPLWKIPVDPWGRDYYLLTAHGLIPPAETSFGPNTLSYDFGGGAGSEVVNNVFDRPTILSLGPDRLFRTADDLVIHF